MPPKSIWITIEPGLQFRQIQREDDDDSRNQQQGGNKGASTVNIRKLIYEFKAENPSGDERIRKFIKEAYQYYVKKLESSQDLSRYLYILLKSKTPVGNNGGDDGNSSNSNRLYKRYKLSDEKTFETLFFREKKKLLTVIEHFTNKTGKYAIRGYPHKLGLLLHGPPGTGKTSLIKALAQHTGRAVVTIPLSRIETNQELMDIMFDQSFPVQGEDLPCKLQFKDVIFVMEDVDAASSIVLSREGASKRRAAGTRGGASVVGPAVGGSARYQVPDMMSREVSDIGGSVKDRGLVVVPPPVVSSEGSAEFAAIKEEMEKDRKTKAMLDDKLDLAGLLNVLDGVVDTPGRIFIMTSNHPEKLDRALIRPGRVDKIIYLGYLKYDEALEMLAHYFPEESISEYDKAALAGIYRKIEYHSQQATSTSLALGGGGSGTALFSTEPLNQGFTPAEMEQMCSECESIADFLRLLEGRVDERRAFVLEAGDDAADVPPMVALSRRSTVHTV